MKKLLLVILSLSIAIIAQAQLNVSYVSNYQYDVNLSDIWGYVAPDSTEYALVGLRNGVSIVSLADPENPVEVANIPGSSTTWRDLKTWGETAYVTCDACGDGLLVIDLSDLPNSAPYYNWTDVPGGGIESCHNIYIDEFGYAYLAGCGANNGGMVYIDCFSNPGTPAFAGFAPSTYAHDVYVRNNLMYASEIYEGRFAIYDVSDKSNAVFLGGHETPATFTHNAWPSDDDMFLFTTDETGNAPIGSYDISDPSDIVELDQFRPLETLGDGVIPHNVHVWNDYLIISYYTDGCIIVDAAQPDNLIMVGNFDTYIPASTGFSGAWGAYPFLPSGLILISDIGNGLYVLAPNYVRACYLEGTVTDASSGLGLNNVTIEINTTELYDAGTNPDGTYATGLAIPGTFEVTYSHPGYYPQTVSVTFENGVETVQDIMLEPFQMFDVSGVITDAVTGGAIPFATIIITGEGETRTETADANGNFSFGLFDGSFNVTVGAWGYGYAEQSYTISGGGVSGESLELMPGYMDDFALDYGWIISGNASSGQWELGVPQGTSYQGQNCNTAFDIFGDVGNQCYVTGNGGGDAGNDDVDDGTVTLTSPPMDLSNYENPTVSFHYWFFNEGGNSTPNDALEIRVSNGQTEATVAFFNDSNSNWIGPFTFNLLDYIGLTDNMQVIFETSDAPNSGHLVEAAIDGFLVTDNPDITNTATFDRNDFGLFAAPNPFTEQVNIQYELAEGTTTASLHVFNLLGERMHSEVLSSGQGNIQLAADFPEGIYFVRIETPEKASAPLKIIKSGN